MRLFSNKKLLVTHNGSFHADDVFAAATLLLVYPDAKIMRTRDPIIIKKGDIVFDVGREYDPSKGRFDHHQEGGAGKRENGIPFAAFGLVWKTYGEKLSVPDAAAAIDKKLVSFIDAGDNGVDLFEFKTTVGNFGISDIIGGFNRQDVSEEEIYKIFLKVVSLAQDVIRNEIHGAEEFIEAKKVIEETYQKMSDKRLLVLDKEINKVILNAILPQFPEVLFVVQPYDNNTFALRAARKNPGSFENRKNLPSAWAGKVHEELQKITGVSDALFCHNSLFVAIAKTKEGTLRLAELALNN